MPTNYRPTRLNLESLGEHALLHPIPDSCRVDVHWLIANARLIAAAPELLAACEELLDAYAPKRANSAFQHLHSSVRIAMAAISKATI